MYSPTQAYTPGQNLDTTRALLIGMKEKGTLQSYVAQHKNSPEYPYLLALASSINQISDAAKAAQHQPAPQTVADQKLNALAPAPAPQATPLPEDVGIGQLPAQNIANMAGGGIVAFGDGGHIPSYSGRTDGSLVFDPETGTFVEDTARKSPVTLANERIKQETFIPTSKGLMSRAQAQAQGLADLSAAKPAGSQTSTMPSSAYTRPAMQNDPRLVGASTFSEQTAPTFNQQKAEAAVADEGKATTKRPPQPGLESVDAFANQLTGIDKFLPPKERAKDRAAFLAEREGINKPFYEKAGKLIEDEKNKLKDDREQSFYMSLIEGGLAAAGGTSQYGLQNLAQGFSKGTASFGEALKDLRKAAKENSKMELEMERAKAADKRGDLDAYQRHEDSIRESNAKIDQLKTSGIFGLMGDKMRADATVRAAGITASGQSSIARELGNGDLRKGMEMLATIQAGKRTIAQSYEDYLKAWAGKDTTMGQPLDPRAYASLIAQVNAATSKAPTASTKATGKVFD